MGMSRRGRQSGGQEKSWHRAYQAILPSPDCGIHYGPWPRAESRFEPRRLARLNWKAVWNYDEIWGMESLWLGLRLPAVTLRRQRGTLNQTSSLSMFRGYQNSRTCLRTSQETPMNWVETRDLQIDSDISLELHASLEASDQ